MDHGLHDSQIELEDKVRKRKVVDLGPIMLDAERCVALLALHPLRARGDGDEPASSS